MIPIEIGGVLFIRICAEQPEGERRLADLSRTADQDHFRVEGPSDRTLDIAWDTHKMEL